MHPFLDHLCQSFGPDFNASRSRHFGSYNFNAFGGQGLSDTAPVMYPREYRASKTQLVKAEEAMCEYDWMFGGIVFVL